jgi:hypothetical protein
MSFVQQISVGHSKLRHLSQTDIPSHIGGDKSPSSPKHCPLHVELLSKTKIGLNDSSNEASMQAWDKIQQDLFGNFARRKLLQEIVKEAEIRRERRVSLTREQLYHIAEEEPDHLLRQSIRGTIRKREFQLEPIMYEDFIIL